MTATLPLMKQPKTSYNPKGPKDDFKKFWTPYELIQAAKALNSYNVSELYGLRNPNTVKRILHLVLLVEKYKPLFKDMLKVGEYFQHFPEDTKDEALVFLSLFDVLCRGENKSLESELLMSDREDYKDSGLKVVYMQVEKDRMQYYEQLLDRLNDLGATFVYQLLPHVIPVKLNLEYPKTLDIWINKSKLKTLTEDKELLLEAGLNKAGKRNLGTYQEISMLPHFYQLEISEFSSFIESSHYFNKIFIPADRNHCLAAYEIVTELTEVPFEDGIVIQTHILSLSATAYFAYMLSITFSSPVKLLVYGADKMKGSYESYFNLLGLKNVTVISERFYVINPRHKDISETVCVLVNPETTFDESLNIIDKTIDRGCDIVFLQSVCEMFHENGVLDSLFLVQYKHDLMEFAKRDMQRALSIPHVKFVVYQSCDQNETLSNNLGLDVVKYKSECAYASDSSVTSVMSTTAKYRYLRKLDLCFKQRKDPNNIVDPEMWGSDPPLVTFFHRTKDKKMESKTGTKEERKHKVTSFKKQLTVPSVYHRFRNRQKTQVRAMPSAFNIIPTKHAKLVKKSGAFTYPAGVERTKVLYPGRQESINLRKILEKKKLPPKKEKPSILSTSSENSEKSLRKKKTYQEAKNSKQSSLRNYEKNIKCKEEKHSPPLNHVETDGKKFKLKRNNIKVQKRKLGLMNELEVPVQKELVHLRKNTEIVTEHSVSSESIEKETKYSNSYRRSLKKNLTFEKEQTLLLAQQESLDIKQVLDVKKNQNSFDCKKISSKKKKIPEKEVNIKNEILQKIVQKLAQLEQSLNRNKTKKNHPMEPAKREQKNSKDQQKKIENKNLLVKKAVLYENGFAVQTKLIRKSYLCDIAIEAHATDTFVAMMNGTDNHIDSVENKTGQERNKKISSMKGQTTRTHLNDNLEMVFNPKVTLIDSISQMNYKSDAHDVDMLVAVMNQTETHMDSVANKTDLEKNTTDNEIDKLESTMDETPRNHDSSEMVSDKNAPFIDSDKADAQGLDRSFLSEAERESERLYSKVEDVTVMNKLMSWFRRLESKDLGPRPSSFGIRRTTRLSSFPFRRTTDFGEKTEGLEEFTEEETDQEEIPDLRKDYHIPNAPAIRKRMKLFQEGERDIYKLLCPGGGEDLYVDSDDESVLKQAETKISDDVKLDNEHKEFLQKHARKHSLKDYDSLSSVDRPYLESAPIEEDFFQKLNELMNTVFEPNAEVGGDQFDEIVTPKKATPPVHDKEALNPLFDIKHLQPFLSSLEDQYLPPSIIASLIGKEIQKWEEEVERKKKEEEDKKKEEEEELIRQEKEKVKKQLKSHDWKLVDVVPIWTPTDGLSTLAKELYELRDVFEYYLNSNSGPLDWRVMIDRRIEE